MDDSSTSIGCEALLSHARWVRNLARHLTRDAHAADDLAQDALAAALAHPPPGDRPLRAWLAGIVRNLAREGRRSTANRSARERAAASSRTEPSGEELLERLDSHRAVVEAVARLEDPYRTAVLLRYFEGLSPAAIAARTSTPLRTVHTRLHRALQRLREDLDRAHGGDGKKWLLAILPFARGSERAWPIGLGGLVMDVKLKAAAAAVVIAGLCGTIAFWPEGDGEEAAAAGTVASIADEAGPKSASTAEPALEHAAPERRAAEPTAPEAASTTAMPVAPAPARLVGRVIDVEGAPVGGIEVAYFGPERGAGTKTDASGRFELDLPASAGHLDVASESWTALLRPQFASAPEAADARELVLVVARSLRLSGAVVDEELHGIEGATLAVALPFGLRSRFDAVLDRSTLVEAETTTAGDGTFELARVPLVAGARLETRHAKYVADERALSEADDLGLEIVLRSVAADPARVVGTVVDAAGEPVEGAWVRLGEETARSGAGGAFSFAEAAEAASVVAVRKGFLPGTVARLEGGAWPQPLVVRLGEPALTIEGKVVDADGKPVANALVWSDSEERFGFVEIEGGENSMRAGANFEGVLRGDPWTRRFQADASGAFRLEGLLPKDYRVHALDRERLVAASVEVSAGARGVELRMPKEDVHERVAGRVTSLGGDPIAGLTVALERAMPGVRGSEIERIEGLSTKTDAEGRFAFENVSRKITSVNVEGTEIGLMGVQRPLRPGEDLEAIEIAAPMQVHVQVEAGGRKDFDQVAVLDEQGEKLYLALHHGHSAYAMREVPLAGERTEVFAVPETGRTLVLYKLEAEVERVPLKLVRGEVNTVRP